MEIVKGDVCPKCTKKGFKHAQKKKFKSQDEMDVTLDFNESMMI